MDPGRKSRAGRRLWTAVAAAFALPLSMLATGATTAHAASVQCSVDYRTNDARLRLHGQPDAVERLERHLVPVRQDRHREERLAQRHDRRGRGRLHRCAVQTPRPRRSSTSGSPDTWNPSSPGSDSGLHVTVADYGAKSGDATAKSTAKALLDGMWNNSRDSLGVAVPETRSDYSRFGDSVYVPSGWSGTMPNGDPVNSSATFTSIRSF